MAGLFISIEGPDGSGKSTLIQVLAKKIIDYSEIPLVVTREPGGGKIAEKIRGLVLDHAHQEMDDWTEALLYAASRRQHVAEKIMPALESGKIVLTDRFVDSSIAYQGNGRQLGMEKVARLNDFATQGLVPDLTIYVDIPVQVGLDRIGNINSNREKDRLELERIDFHHRVRTGYESLIAQDQSGRFKQIDGTQSPERVAELAWQYVKAAIQETFNERGIE